MSEQQQTDRDASGARVAVVATVLLVLIAGLARAAIANADAQAVAPTTES